MTGAIYRRKKERNKERNKERLAKTEKEKK